MSKRSSSEDEVFDFGFQKVSSTEKTKNVGEVFNRVASRYDLMNDLMSLGLHRVWKTRFVESLPLREGGTYLDVAGGTGDIAQAIFERLKRFGFQAQVMVSDINQQMIEKGQRRRNHLTWLCANAEELPLKDNSVDVYTISFGFRNVTHRENALTEALRVLKPGGHFACLEFSHVDPPLDKLYDLYAFHIIPKMGEWIAGDRAAYQYLSESIKIFLTREELASLMKKVGFQSVAYETFTGGIVALHWGTKKK